MHEPKTYEFKRHAAAQARLQSAVRLVKLLLQDDPKILPEHRQELVSIALWKITEAESVHKHRTRYCSQTVFTLPESECRHDHVFQRGIMVRDLIRGGPEAVDKILERAVACTITKEEHVLLNEHKAADGWERYRRAGITVIDSANGAVFEFPEVERIP